MELKQSLGKSGEAARRGNRADVRLSTPLKAAGESKGSFQEPTAKELQSPST